LHFGFHPRRGLFGVGSSAGEVAIATFKFGCKVLSFGSGLFDILLSLPQPGL
jgi:hypothetical protein